MDRKEPQVGIRTTVVGSYPKPPDEGSPFVVRKTLHALERGDATVADLDGARDELVRSIVAEQQDAGIDLITDGHARWDDIVTPFARAFDGFEIGGLLRFFDNNVYYRRPVVTGPVGWREPASVEAFAFAAAAASAPVKAVIPGPVTFARLSVDEHYFDDDALILDLASTLAREAKALQEAGATSIQIDEPALLGAPEDLALAATAIGTITQELDGIETTLATYFGDAKRLGAELFALPVDVFALDLISGPDNEGLIDLIPSEKGLQAGIVDARNTKLEDASTLTATIGSLAAKVGAERLRVAPSCGLEFLPREKARAKLHRLAEAARKAGN